MSTLIPRPFYSPEEIAQLYPPSLKLHYVQVVSRHGERVPVRVRLQNAGVPKYWDLCGATRHFSTAVLGQNLAEQEYNKFNFQRSLEQIDQHRKLTQLSQPSRPTWLVVYLFLFDFHIIYYYHSLLELRKILTIFYFVFI